MKAREISAVGASFKVSDSPYPQFWDKFEQGKWEPATLHAIGTILGPGWQFLDVGAWIGPTALLGAAKGARTWAFEPDPVAFERLSTNRELNSLKIRSLLRLENAAAGKQEGVLRLYASTYGNSETSVYSTRERAYGIVNASNEFEARQIDMKSFIANNIDLEQPVFIKVDIEGGEYELVPYIVDYLRTANVLVMHVSTHPFNIVNPDRDAQVAARQAANGTIAQSLRGMRFHRALRDGVEVLDEYSEVARLVDQFDRGADLLVSNFVLD